MQASALSTDTCKTAFREAAPGSLYTFEVWGAQLLDFIDQLIGEPAFLVSNSVGGTHSASHAQSRAGPTSS